MSRVPDRLDHYAQIPERGIETHVAVDSPGTDDKCVSGDHAR